MVQIRTHPIPVVVLRRDQWLKTLPEKGKEDFLGVFQITKRQVPRTAWEPIYIGTNEEPLYDERLTWEGKRDKMSQVSCSATQADHFF
ncbi:hypothetical protein AVEN_163847-1 [Araneus ventricosus]|uniref:Uncharacterized protein n=1 Tax=Araneus ventricosus TaxID=182803 RepID=A0A4Y2TJG1_ARAVE|nr:hypothetical protein AVEN_163847-1 [Araneus ventricosus]